MKTSTLPTLQGVFQHLVYSPKGEIEGVMLEADGDAVQVVIDRYDPAAAAAFDQVAAGQVLALRASLQAPSPKGRGPHAVYDFEALISIDGHKPAKPKTRLGPAYQGKVSRFNYAKHGEVNGVVLDSGDFIHTRPDGMARLGLQIGDRVEADGDAQRLVDDAGWAVEATIVNGKALKAH